MSIYSNISKRIGWQGHCAIPSLKTARELLREVEVNHRQSAFEMVFKIHRFASTPETDAEREAMGVIWNAFFIGRDIFQKQ